MKLTIDELIDFIGKVEIVDIEERSDTAIQEFNDYGMMKVARIGVIMHYLIKCFYLICNNTTTVCCISEGIYF